MDQSRYAELFRTESREHLAEIDAAVLALEQSGDMTHVATLFRSTHTIKGMAGAMGYGEVERISHSLETLLDLLRAGTQSLDPDAIALLFDGSDALRHALETVREGPPTHVSPAVQRLLDRLAARADAGAPGDLHAASNALSTVPVHPTSDLSPRSGTAIAPESLALDADHLEIFGALAATPAPIGEVRIVDVRLTADCPLKGVRAMLVLTRLRALGVVKSTEPTQHAWQEERFDGTFAITLHTDSDDARLEASVRAAGDVARVAVRGPDVARRSSGHETMRTVRIDLRRLDTLLDLVGELVITRDRLLREADVAVENGADRALARIAHDTARLVSALQDEVLQARMVPVGQVFDRFPRLVRDLARDLGKDVRFTTEGREIELDRSLLEAIGDPILHLLRNALDHGIEDAETRRAAGKPATGQLVLRAGRDRASVVLQVEDDGRGIDRAAILARAQAEGVVDPDLIRLDDDRLLQVLAHAGFSTARAVTSISGRGVGVDVVMTRVRSLGGALEVETLEGQGTVFTLRLPATLAFLRALLVQVEGECYALPAAHVIEVLDFTPGMIVTSLAREWITLRDETLPVVRLRDRFGCARTEEEAFVVVVESSDRRTALLVDGLHTQQDIVVKALDVVRGSAPLFTGATVLGDGTPALIVDVGSLG